MMFRPLKSVLAGFVGVALMSGAAVAAAPGTIVDVAVANGNFKTLVAAVKAAGLAETLSGKGPLTVFAPTDAAFAKLPAGTVDALLKDIPKLKAILTYHVVSGAVMAKYVKTGTVPTVNGQSLDANNHLSIAQNRDVRIVTSDNDLTAVLRRPKALDNSLGHE